MRISDWSSDVCSSDLIGRPAITDATASSRTRQAGHPRPGYLRQRMSTNSQSETSPDRFVELTRAGRVWAIAAVHGDAGRLAAIHDGIGERFQSGDRLVYLVFLIGVWTAVAVVLAGMVGARFWVESFHSFPPSGLIRVPGGVIVRPPVLLHSFCITPFTGWLCSAWCI